MELAILIIFVSIPESGYPKLGMFPTFDSTPQPCLYLVFLVTKVVYGVKFFTSALKPCF